MGCECKRCRKVIKSPEKPVELYLGGEHLASLCVDCARAIGIVIPKIGEALDALLKTE